jgi:hypothetical protein
VRLREREADLAQSGQWLCRHNPTV